LFHGPGLNPRQSPNASHELPVSLGKIRRPALKSAVTAPFPVQIVVKSREGPLGSSLTHFAWRKRRWLVVIVPKKRDTPILKSYQAGTSQQHYAHQHREND
jgi:hypothetical protein